MQQSSDSLSLAKAALVAGISSIVMAAAAGFAELGARQALIIPTDAAATAQNILANPTTFRLGILCYFIVLICDLLAAWAYGAFFKKVNGSLSQLAAWFRIAYSVVFGVAITSLVSGLHLITRGAPDAAQQALQQFSRYEDLWQIGFLFFSGHLILLGYLALRSQTVPKILGALLLAAGIGYGLNALAHTLLPDYASYQAVFSALSGIPSALGEIGIAIWLLVKGTKLKSE